MTTNQILKQLIGNSVHTKFADKHGISRRSIEKWVSKNNERNIKLSTLEKIAKTEGYKIINEIKLEKL